MNGYARRHKGESVTSTRKLKLHQTWKNVGKTAGTWDPPTAETEFQQQFTAHSDINALLSPNDENAAPIIHYLQGKGVKANTFPVTGQDATLVGLDDILSG